MTHEIIGTFYDYLRASGLPMGLLFNFDPKRDRVGTTQTVPANGTYTGGPSRVGWPPTSCTRPVRSSLPHPGAQPRSAARMARTSAT